ncbi:MAG: universal stress protein [Saprospiraceae bacterium]|nr:universal stress protein [Saprospiraceae bacterium]
MEKKIAITFDFSTVSKNAVQYALESSEDIDILEIIHVDNSLVNSNDEETLKEKIKNDLCEYLSEESLPNNISIHVLHGNIINTLSKYIKEKLYDYVIVGSRDKYNILERWIGTVSLGLVKTLDVPILLIPRFSKYNKYKKVVVASDHHLNHKALLYQIRIWNKPYNAFIKFVHVKESNNDNYDNESKTIVKELFENDPVSFGFEVSTLKSKNISESLLSNAYNAQADAMIIISKNSSFMNALLFKSISKEMIEKSSIPVLFLHV